MAEYRVYLTDRVLHIGANEFLTIQADRHVMLPDHFSLYRNEQQVFSCPVEKLIAWIKIPSGEENDTP